MTLKQSLVGSPSCERHLVHMSFPHSGRFFFHALLTNPTGFLSVGEERYHSSAAGGGLELVLKRA
jgi:hypothetical protein